MRVKLIAAPDHGHCSKRGYRRDPQICFVPINKLDRVTPRILCVLIAPVYLFAETMGEKLTQNWILCADKSHYSILHVNKDLLYMLPFSNTVCIKTTVLNTC
jgi:hypothetical protein